LRRPALVLVCLVWIALAVPCAAVEPATSHRIPLAWFNEPEQHAPHWKVTLGPVSLLYSQRFVIHAEAILPSRLKKGERESDWHIIFRVADEHGKWFDGASYTHLEWKRVPAKVENVMWSIAVFSNGIIQGREAIKANIQLAINGGGHIDSIES
jgi:hypothetical protein